MNKQIILFDIDKTLFNGEYFWLKLITPSLEKNYKISRERFEQGYFAYKKTLEKNTDFNPEEFADFLVAKINQKNFSRADLLNIFYKPEFFSKSIFPEVKSILAELQKDYVLGIFSEGFEFWQRKKLDNMGIKYYFEQNLVFIKRRKTAVAVLESLPEKAMVVDDNVEVIRDLVNFGRVIPIWINRVNKPVIEGVMQIKNLTELPMILTRLVSN